VEGGVEHRDVGRIRQRCSRGGERVEGRPVVERCEIDELAELADDVVVHEHRRDEAVAAVDDAVSDGLDLLRVDDLRRLDEVGFLGGVDERQLQARRPRIDDENAQKGQTQSRMAGSSSPCARV
jgi:hypothetical protein